MEHHKRYLSYLLRLWQECGGEAPVWRASLESPQNDDLQGFASLAELFEYLAGETGSSLPHKEPPQSQRQGDELGARHIVNPITGLGSTDGREDR